MAGGRPLCDVLRLLRRGDVCLRAMYSDAGCLAGLSMGERLSLAERRIGGLHCLPVPRRVDLVADELAALTVGVLACCLRLHGLSAGGCVGVGVDRGFSGTHLAEQLPERLGDEFCREMQAHAAAGGHAAGEMCDGWRDVLSSLERMAGILSGLCRELHVHVHAESSCSLGLQSGAVDHMARAVDRIDELCAVIDALASFACECMEDGVWSARWRTEVDGVLAVVGGLVRSSRECIAGAG